MQRYNFFLYNQNFFVTLHPNFIGLLYRENRMRSYIPKYLTAKKNVIIHILGTALLGEMILVIFKPFDSTKWLPNEVAGTLKGDLLYIGFATLAVLVAMGIIAISRTWMYHYAKKHAVSYWTYACWIIGELLVMSVVYAAFPIVARFTTPSVTFSSLYKESILYTFFILLIPYAIFILWFSLKDKTLELQKLKLKWMEQEREKNLETHDGTLLNFVDEKGDFCLSVRQENLFYIDAADNYVKVHYKNGGKVQHFVIRNSLKNIEAQFQDYGLVRCHRSYIVNFYAVKVLRRSDEGLMLEFDDETIKNIPVSRSYSEEVIKRFMK